MQEFNIGICPRSRHLLAALGSYITTHQTRFPVPNHDMAEKDDQGSSSGLPWYPPPSHSGSSSTSSGEDEDGLDRSLIPGPAELGAQTGDGGGPAIRDVNTATGLGIPLESDTPELEGVGVYAPSGPGTPRTPFFRPRRGLQSPRSPNAAVFLQFARRTSGATTGGFRASNFRSHGIMTMPAEADLYSANPELPSFHEEGKDPEYGLLGDVTTPKRDGMLDRVDPHSLLRTRIGAANDDIRHAWERFLTYYDIAMEGKCDALLKLVGAIERLDQVQDHVSGLEGKVNSLGAENSRQLGMLESLEKMVSDERERARQLGVEKGVMAREKDKLERCFKEANAERDAQLKTLEEMIADWETLSGRSDTSSQTRGDADPESRFESIREAFRQAHMASKLKEATLKRLEAQRDDLLRQGTKMSTFSGSSGDRSNAGEARELESDLQHHGPKEGSHAPWWEADYPTEPIMPSSSEGPQTEVERLEGELGQYRARCLSLQEKVDDLKGRLDAQAVEAAQEKLEHTKSLDEIANSMNDIDAIVSRVVAASQSSRGAESASGNPQESLLPQEFVRDVEAAHSEALQSSRAVMDEIKAKIADLVKRVSTELAEAKATHAEEKRQVLEEVTQYIATINAWIQTHQEMEGNQGLIEDELDALRQQVNSQQQVFHEIGQQVRHQRSRVEAARSSSRHIGTSSTSSTIPRPKSISGGPSGGSASDAGPDEVWALREARKLIEQLKSSGLVEAAVRACGEKLSALRKRLSERDPDTPTERLLTALEKLLMESSQTDIENDSSDFHTKLDKYDRDLKSLLELEQFAPKESESDRALLLGIEAKLEAAGALQMKQTRLMNECKDYREKNAPPPLTASQSEELVRLISNLLASNGGSWSQADLAGQDRDSPMSQLVSRIRRMLSVPFLAERQRELRDCIRRQGVLVEELVGDADRVAVLAQHAGEDIKALHSLRERGWSPSTGYDDLAYVIQAKQERRGRDLERLKVYTEGYLSFLDMTQEEVTDFLETTSAADRHHAGGLLSETLFRLHGSGGTSPHGGAACFCTLLRFFLPRVYYSTVIGGCCAESSRIAHNDSGDGDDAVEPVCQGHHGHGVLTSSSRAWTTVCRAMTAITWLILLALMQPYNLATSAWGALSFLFGMPVYVWWLLSGTPTGSQDQNRGEREGQKHDEDQEEEAPLPTPNRPLSRLPEPATLVGAGVTIFLFIAWLSYAAVVAERRLWVGDNDWRYGYVLDLTSGRPLPYAGWSPVRVDYRLVYEPVWEAVAGWAHGLFSWRRYIS